MIIILSVEVILAALFDTYIPSIWFDLPLTVKSDAFPSHYVFTSQVCRVMKW